MDRLYVDIGARMRSLRLAARLTQAQLAERVGIDASFYGQIERGKNVPSLKTFLAISSALGVEPGTLLPSSERGEGSAYQQVIERLVGGLDPKKKKLALDMLSDMVERLKR